MVKQISLHLSYTMEKPLVFILFLFSFISTTTLIAATLIIILLLIWKNRITSGSVKSLIFIAIRTIINPGIASGYDTIGIIKWILVIGLAGLIIISSGKNKSIKCRKAVSCVALFSLYVIIISVVNSSYPVVSSFKVFSWAFVFCAVIVGICQHSNEDWLGYLSWLLNLMILLSPITLPLGVAYLRNGHAFQGIINHPNMLGIVACVTFAVDVYLLQERKERYRIILLALCVIECILSESRTGLLCIAISMIIYFVFNIQSKLKKIVLISIILVSIAFLFEFGFGSAITSYMYKGQSIGNLLYSREGQIANAMEKFNANSWIGSGFMVPNNFGHKSYEFSFELTVEPGNLLFSLLGDVGIVGLTLFGITFLRILWLIDKRKTILFLTPFITSMGEMMFFSTNNIAIVYYILIGCCLLPISQPYQMIMD